MQGIDFSASDYIGEALQTAETFEAGAKETVELEVDAVIAGSGPGGLCAGCALAEAGADVLVLEAGQFWRPSQFVRNMNFAQRHLYQARGTRVTMGNVFIPLTSGRGVGGGTLVNSAICFRAPDRVLDDWVERWGMAQFEASRREALYAEVEDEIGVVDTAPAIAGNNSHIARRGFAKLGLDHDYMPRNASGCAGCGTCHTGCPSGGKASADLNWLPRLLDSGGVVYADTRVEKIAVESGRATGVRATMREPETERTVANLKVRADRVLLGCGAINTPMLLQKEGLGDVGGHLGHHLHIHPGISALARMDEEVHIWEGATQGYYAHHPEEDDVLLETFSAPPDALLSQSSRIGYDANDFLRNLRYLAGCGAMIRDESSGRVKRRGDGRADIRYFVEEADRRRLVAGLEVVAQMFFAAGARGVMPLLKGARFYGSLNRTLDAIVNTTNVSHMNLYASHPMGTCRAHPDADHGVVHPKDGMVHGVDNLHVVDA
ncbi:MAG: GMC family oxidoreductase N-terminal domain-containing protein, partial [Persicimonas sp.]